MSSMPESFESIPPTPPANENPATTPDLPTVPVPPENASKLPKIGRSGLRGNHGSSGVWTNHFFRNLIPGTKTFTGIGTCNYCGINIKAPSKNGTTVLWNHLDRCVLYNNTKNDVGQGVPFDTSIDEQPINWHFDQAAGRKALIRLVILCELPFCFVEKMAFRLFCHTLQPRFSVVGRTCVTQDCLKLFEVEKKKLKNVFKVLCTRVCITTDMWTSIQNLPYMAVTAHYVDKDWCLQKRIIAFRLFPHPHSGINIAKALEATLLEWELNKVFTITLDNAKNNDVAVDDLRVRLNRRNAFLSRGDFFHVRCFAHVLNLVVKAGLEHSIQTVKRLRRSVKYVRSSPSRFQAFKLCAQEENIKTKKYLCLDVKTRWNSSYLMINAALGFRTAFERLEDHDSFYKDVTKVNRVLDEDWEKLEALHVFLKEFYEITVRVSGSKYVTSITYMDEVKLLKGLLDLHLRGHEASELYKMAELMSEKFEKYCKIDDINMILLVAMVLDPRNKMEYAEWVFKKYYGENRLLGLVANLKDFMVRLYKQYMPQEMSAVRIEINDDASMGGNKRDQDRKEFDQHMKATKSGETMNGLEKYLADNVEENHPDFNILEWWKGNTATYGGLALMARDVLAVPITSVASECAFSTAKRVLDPFRSSLTPITTEALICTQDWLKNAISQVDILDEELESLERIEKEVLQTISGLSTGEG